MIAAYTVEQIRAAEERAFAALRTSGDDEGALMQRAAAGAAAVALDLLDYAGGARVLLVAGSGNNGGDGLYACWRLARRGVAVDVMATGSSLHEGGWAALGAAGGRRITREQALAALEDDAYDLVLDAVLGIGGRPGLKPEVAELADACIGTPVLAIDLPSGLAADEVTAYDCFPATTTVTFGGHKICQLADPARSACGDVHLVDIGLEFDEPTLLAYERDDVAALIPVPGPTSDKYSRGVVGLDVGSEHYPGAGVMAHQGVAHVGVGMIRSLGAKAVADAVIAVLPNVLSKDGRVQARLLGSGWGERPDGDATVAKALDQGDPCVFDAEALMHLPDRIDIPCLLTPHAGELARLLEVERSVVEADPIAHARQAADRTGATVLLKGATQYVAEPGSPLVHLAVQGPAWTGQAGSGDTLAGLCSGLLAGGLSPAEAGAVGASLQALTAAAHPGPWPPQTIACWVPETIADLVAGRG